MCNIQIYHDTAIVAVVPENVGAETVPDTGIVAVVPVNVG
jgi:hypothetical protein